MKRLIIILIMVFVAGCTADEECEFLDIECSIQQSPVATPAPTVSPSDKPELKKVCLPPRKVDGSCLDYIWSMR